MVVESRLWEARGSSKLGTYGEITGVLQSHKCVRFMALVETLCDPPNYLLEVGAQRGTPVLVDHAEQRGVGGDGEYEGRGYK